MKSEDIVLPEKFVVGVLIEKLPDSWNDYKNSLKHKQKNQTLDELVTHILIEDTNRKRSSEAKAKEMSLKANLVQGSTSGKGTKPNLKSKANNFKKKSSYFVCGKSGHHAAQCRKRARNGNPPKANLVEGDDVIVAVISQANLAATANEWIADSGATRHICGTREAFSSYTVGDDNEVIYLGDSRTAKV